MEMKKVGKLLLPIGALALTFVSGVLNDKVRETQLEKTVAKKVAEALENQAKES